MAKQRRTRPKTSTRKKVRSGARKAAAGKSESVQPPASALLERRASYVEAVALYERGLEALQRRRFPEATDAFRRVLDQYPEERELHERVRLYLKVCERETTGRAPAPQTLEERIYAATLAFNAGAYSEALGHLQAANDERPDDDHVHYMLAVAYTLRGDRDLALTHLRRAIELNPHNRPLARQEPDFAAIRNEEGFRRAVETPPAPARRRSRRRAAR